MPHTFRTFKSRIHPKKTNIVTDDGADAVKDLRAFVGSWPYETAWAEVDKGASVLTHEARPITDSLTASGWTEARK